MKRITLAIVVLLVIANSACAAPPDFSVYTYDQLIAISHVVTQEIMRRPEWKELKIPSGTWIVGVDIPEGQYAFYPTEKGGYLTILDDKGRTLISQGIRNDNDAVGKVFLNTAYTVQVENGSLIIRPADVLGF